VHVVVESNAVVQPIAVMVEVEGASVALATVLRGLVHVRVAHLAPHVQVSSILTCFKKAELFSIILGINRPLLQNDRIFRVYDSCLVVKNEDHYDYSKVDYEHWYLAP